MASETQDTLYDAFSNAAGSQAEALEPITSASDKLAESLRSVTQQMGGGPSQYSAETSSNASKSGASEALSIATTVLESGLGIIPLVTGLIESMHHPRFLILGNADDWPSLQHRWDHIDVAQAEGSGERVIQPS